MTDTLPAVRDRIRAYWAGRRSCGLIASAAGLRVERVIALVQAGGLDAEAGLRMALEAEAVALCLAPLPLTRGSERNREADVGPASAPRGKPQGTTATNRMQTCVTVTKRMRE